MSDAETANGNPTGTGSLLWGISTGNFEDPRDLDSILAFEPSIVEIYGSSRADFDWLVSQCQPRGIAIALHVPTALETTRERKRPFEPTSSSPELVAEAIGQTVGALKLAEEVEAQHVVVHVPSPFQHDHAHRAEVQARAQHFLEEVSVRRTDACQLLIENVTYNRGLYSPEHYERLISGQKDTGFCVDFGHAELLRPAFSVSSFLDCLGPLTVSAHAYWQTRGGAGAGRTLGSEGSTERAAVVAALGQLCTEPSLRSVILELTPMCRDDVATVAEQWSRTLAAVAASQPAQTEHIHHRGLAGQGRHPDPEIRERYSEL